MDIEVAQKIANALLSQSGVMVFVVLLFGAMYIGKLRWERELLEVEEDRDFWKNDSKTLRDQIAARQKQVEDDLRQLQHDAMRAPLRGAREAG